jgi:low affinity Fe/Cu permease
MAAPAAIGAVGFASTPLLAVVMFAAAITVVMVFVIQCTQNRQLLALQIKLGEPVRALPDADDQFVHVERGSDDEL